VIRFCDSLSKKGAASCQLKIKNTFSAMGLDYRFKQGRSDEILNSFQLLEMYTLRYQSILADVFYRT